jgi:hypothetical protein
LTVASALCASANAGIDSNPSFEDGTLGMELPEGATNVDEWTVSRDDINYVDEREGGFETPAGYRTIELSATARGAIEGTIVLDPERTYTLTFIMSGNYTGVATPDAATTSLRISVRGFDGTVLTLTPSTFQHTKPAHVMWDRTEANMLWETKSTEFTTIPGVLSYEVSFKSTSDRGPVIDKIEFTEH